MANKYVITLSWIVETDEHLVPGIPEVDEKLLDIVRHKASGKSSCATCPARFPANYTIKRVDLAMDGPVYMSPDRFIEDDA
jgi:hypothetical protein